MAEYGSLTHRRPVFPWIPRILCRATPQLTTASGGEPPSALRGPSTLPETAGAQTGPSDTCSRGASGDLHGSRGATVSPSWGSWGGACEAGPWEEAAQSHDAPETRTRSSTVK